MRRLSLANEIICRILIASAVIIVLAMWALAMVPK